MTVRDLEGMFDYGYWANRKVFDVIVQLTPEQFTQPVAGSYGSIRNTLVHVLSAEWGWLSRCGGPEHGQALNPEDYATAEYVVEAWGRVEAYVREFLAKLKDEDLARNVEFRNPRGEKRVMVLGELIQHAAAQVALLLRLLGHVPGNFDLLCRQAQRDGVVDRMASTATQHATGAAR